MKPKRTSPKQIERCERFGNLLWARLGNAETVFGGLFDARAKYHVFVNGEPLAVIYVNLAEIDAADTKDDLFGLAREVITRFRKRG